MPNLRIVHPTARSLVESGSYDAFLSHDWGSEARNHKLVGRVSDELHNLGFRTFFDEKDIHDGEMDEQLTTAIQQSDIVFAFITANYVQKAGSCDRNDFCYLEIQTAVDLGKKIIPVVVEANMRDQSRWEGLRFILHKERYIDLSGKETKATVTKAVQEMSRFINRNRQQQNSDVLEMIQKKEEAEHEVEKLKKDLDAERKLRQLGDQRIQKLSQEVEQLSQNVKRLTEIVENLASEKNTLQDEVERLKSSPRQAQERVASRWEMEDMKHPLVSTISGSIENDYNRRHSHLGWWFPPSSPWHHSGEYGWHSHDREEVLYCKSGELRIEANGHINIALPGEKVVVPAGTRHRIPPGSPSIQLAIAGGR